MNPFFKLYVNELTLVNGKKAIKKKHDTILKNLLGSNKFVEFAILSFAYFVNFIKYRAVNMNTHKTIIFFLNVEFYLIFAPECSA